MISNNIEQWVVSSYDELYNLYEEREIGNSNGQTIPEGIPKLKQTPSDKEECLIKSLLENDLENIYHVQVIEETDNRYFIISLLEISIYKEFTLPVNGYSICFGENGRWEEFQVDNKNWEDATIMGLAEVQSSYVEIIEWCELLDEFGEEFKIYFNSVSKKFLAINSTGSEKIFYKLIKPLYKLSREEKDEILDYCLGKGNYTSEEQVTARDVFLHGKFITRI